MPGALHAVGDGNDGGDDDDDDGSGSNNWVHCDKSVEAGGVGGNYGGGSGGGVLRFASLCIYLQLPDGAQQKERVLFFSSFLASPAARCRVLDHVPGSICSV